MKWAMVVGNWPRSATYPQPFSTYFNTPEKQPSFDIDPVLSTNLAQAEANLPYPTFDLAYHPLNKHSIWIISPQLKSRWDCQHLESPAVSTSQNGSDEHYQCPWKIIEPASVNHYISKSVRSGVTVTCNYSLPEKVSQNGKKCKSLIITV